MQKTGSLFADEESQPDLLGFPFVPPDDELNHESAAEYAKKVADWLRQNVAEAVLLRLPAVLLDGSAKSWDDGLKAVMEWWNELARAKIVSYSVRTSSPSKELLDAWAKFKRCKTAQECMADLGKVRSEIEQSSFTRKGGWFRLEKLLSGANGKGGVPIIRTLMDGGYRDGGNGSSGTEQYDWPSG